MIGQSLAHPAHPSTEEETPHGCIAGVVYIGHLVEGEDCEEVEVIERVPCRRCRAADVGETQHLAVRVEIIIL